MVVALGAVLLVGRDHHAIDNGSPGHTITLPAASSGYMRTTGNVADRLTRQVIDGMSAAAPSYRDSYAKAKVGIYSHPPGTGAALVFVGMTAADDPTLAIELNTRTASTEADSAFIGAGVTDTVDVDAGPLGGVLRCSKRPAADGQTVCVWVDRSSIGLLLIRAGPGHGEPGPTAQQFRRDAEL